MKKIHLIAAAVTAAVALVPGIASASFLLDTGTPQTGAGAPLPTVLNLTDWWAAEFTVGSGETITQLGAYLTQGTGNGNAFTWDLYSTNGTFLGAGREAPTDTIAGTYAPNPSGWSVTNVNWTVSPGTYWIAMQVSNTSQTTGLDLPVESSTTTGTVPATEFAFAGSNGRYSKSNTGVGIEVSTVPLPAAAWLFGSGLLGLGAVGRRRRS
jgi:hypothetical protein